MTTAVGLDRETLEMMLSSLDEFVAETLPDQRRLDLDHEDVCPEDTVREMCSEELGVQLVFIPEEYGGLGGGAFDSYRVCERLARVDIGVATSVFATFLGSDPILVGATDEQRKEWLGRIAEQGIIFAYGATEPEAGSDLGAMTTTAAPDRDRRRSHRLPDQRPQAVDQQRLDRRRLLDPGARPRRPVVVRRGEGHPRLLDGAAGRQARDPALQHRRAVPRRRRRARRRTWSAARRATAWCRPSRCSATPA